VNRSIDIVGAATHLFEDPEWVMKALVGGLLLGIPIVNFAAIGYEVRLTRNVSQGQKRPMPAWEDFGGLFQEGLWLGIAQFLLALPIIVLFVLPMVLFFGAVMVASANEAFEDIASNVLGLGMVGFMGLCGLGLLYALVVGFVSPAITANYVRHGTLAACFDVGQLTGFIRRNGADYVLAWVATLLAVIAISVATSAVGVIPCLGTILIIVIAIPAGFWALMVHGHVVGQVLALDEGRRIAATSAASAA
jgi:hypothetical protein